MDLFGQNVDFILCHLEFFNEIIQNKIAAKSPTQLLKRSHHAHLFEQVQFCTIQRFPQSIQVNKLAG